ncbi:MAG: class I SAM-dependent methyltransferase [Kiloniellales bacterium]|nr:class I SAM-dependent methyltransferase [Kiloniellales bacterium]
MPRDDNPPTNGDMDYREFFDRFMGACRRKHIRREPELIELIKDSLKPSRRTRPGNPKRGRSYQVPETAELPREFMRMEPWEIEYLFPLAMRAKKSILETGRRHGGSTFLMACANATVPIRSIDIEPADDDLLRSYFDKVGIGANVEIIVGDSQRGDYPAIGEIDLLFIDGDHSYAGCTADLEQWYPRVVTGGHVVLHDCYFGSEVQPAVIDFIDRHEVELFQGPFSSAAHWRNPAGSLAHFRKKA